ncbi:MAG: hypothetical protein HYU66_10495 [Armatimonadetes bacterium]|nr:hypothetical protein [Armatimonadota bacterium]
MASAVATPVRELIEQQPEDATFEEILRELAFAASVDRGMADVREGRVVSDAQMAERLRRWQRSGRTP